jgi:hypothetical protein
MQDLVVREDELCFWRHKVESWMVHKFA